MDQLGNHDAAFRAFHRYTEGEHSGYCSTHTLAECYATLTSLPVATRISPDEARLLIEDAILDRLAVVPLTPDDYRSVLRHVAALGLGRRRGLRRPPTPGALARSALTKS